MQCAKDEKCDYKGFSWSDVKCVKSVDYYANALVDWEAAEDKKDCASGKDLASGKCVGKDNDADCKSSMECKVGSSCQKLKCAAQLAAGADCTNDDDCPNNQWCASLTKKCTNYNSVELGAKVWMTEGPSLCKSKMATAVGQDFVCATSKNKVTECSDDDKPQCEVEVTWWTDDKSKRTDKLDCECSLSDPRKMYCPKDTQTPAQLVDYTKAVTGVHTSRRFKWLTTIDTMYPLSVGADSCLKDLFNSNATSIKISGVILGLLALLF